ncbi:helix-hairpin-helix domain-containing protein [Candidatus Kaiserbacteria bacterium]|nr:helix-hairpin-helix domain-containing protein [Candidatus Kaiserbacteria bacterium]
MNLRRVAFFFALLTIAPLAFADHNININTADSVLLDTLPGIGPSKAQAIIDYRTQNGSFSTIEEIQNVSGIGPATYEDIKNHITVEGGNSTAPAPSPVPPPTPMPNSTSPSPQSSSSSASAFSVDGGGDRVVVALADAHFAARASSGKSALENVGFSWNFGDGSIAQGTSVIHRFEYPGRYAVVLTGSRDGSSATDSFAVTAEEARISLRALSDGSVEIENLAARDTDLSRWMILSQGQRFTFPENSLVLARQTMHISPNTMHFFASESTVLEFPSGAVAFRASSAGSAIPPAPSTEQLSEVVSPPAVLNVHSTPAPKPVPVHEEVEEIEQELSIATSSQFVAASASSNSWPWWLGAASISFGAAAAIFVSRRYGKREWNIVEE